MATSGSLFSHGMAKWALFVGCLFITWFGGWYLVANFANDRVSAQIKMMSARGLDVSCTHQEIRGFPFRLGLYCSDIDVLSTQNDLEVQTGSLTTAAQIYAPNKVVAELTGPMTLNRTGLNLTASWGLMRGFLHTDFELGFEQLSITHNELKVDFNGTMLSSTNGDLHLRPTPKQDSEHDRTSLDFAGQAQGLKGRLADGLIIPEIAVSIDATLTDGYSEMVLHRQTLEDVLSDGADILVRALSVVTPDGGRFVAAGPIRLDPDGLISGTIMVGADNVRSLANWAGQIDPKVGGVLISLAPALTTMGRRQEIDGKPISTISIQINKGRARVGFIQLGQIPPIFFDR